MGQNVVSVNHVSAVTLGFQASSELRSKKFAYGFDALLARDAGNVNRWFDAQHSHSCTFVVLQEIAVITRDFSHQTVLIKAMGFPDPASELLSMSKHRVRVGREIKIFSKQLLG